MNIYTRKIASSAGRLVEHRKILAAIEAFVDAGTIDSNEADAAVMFAALHQAAGAGQPSEMVSIPWRDKNGSWSSLTAQRYELARRLRDARAALGPFQRAANEAFTSRPLPGDFAISAGSCAKDIKLGAARLAAHYWWRT